MDYNSSRLASLIDFPRTALSHYTSRRHWSVSQAQAAQPRQTSYGSESLSISLGNHLGDQQYFTPSLSPAFASSNVQLSSPPLMSQNPRSPFLDLPQSGVDQYSSYSYASSPNSYQTSSTATYLNSPLASPGYRISPQTPSPFPTTASSYSSPVGTTPGSTSQQQQQHAQQQQQQHPQPQLPGYGSFANPPSLPSSSSAGSVDYSGGTMGTSVASSMTAAGCVAPSTAVWT